MTGVVQRVTEASVETDGVTVGKTGKGLLVLVGIFETDDTRDCEILAAKISGLRIFSDENDKMNLSVLDIGGGILAVSNFTLCADTKKGNRPSFSSAMVPQEANKLYDYFVECLKQNGVKSVETGRFGADMKIPSALDGPITIIMDSARWKK